MTSPDTQRGHGKEQTKPTELSEVLSTCMVTLSGESGKWGSKEDQQEWLARVTAERERFGGKIERECREVLPYLKELCAEGLSPGFILNRVVDRVEDKLGDIQTDRGGTDIGAIGFEAISGVLAGVLSDEMQKEVKDEN